MKNQVKIFALGGLDENGKNMYVVEVNDDIFVLEAGIRYPESALSGVDIIMPDVGYLIKNKHRVKAYFISHGHDDIMGALPYVIRDVPAPIYTSRITSFLIEDAAHRFDRNIKFDFRLVKGNDEIEISGHKVLFFSTTHSVGESLGIAIDTGNGYVVYTGDFIIDYGALPQYRTDVTALAKLGERNVLCLLTESIACDIPGHTSPGHKLTPVVEPVFADAKGRIITSFYTQNLFGIREVIDLAAKYKRKLLIYDEELRRILHLVTRFGLLSIPPGMMLTHEELNRPGNEDAVIIVTGLGENLFRSLERIAGGDAEKHLVVQPTDTFIIASPTIPGLEVMATKVIDEIYKTGASVLNIKRRQVVSMHAHGEDIKMILTLLRPKYFMPVKGEYRHLLTNAQIAVGMQQGFNHTNTFVYDNGMIALFEDGVYKGYQGSIDVGEIMVDGLGVGDVGNLVLNDRQKLADNGVIILGVTVDTQAKKIVAGPDVQMRGLVYLKDADKLLKDVITTFESMVLDSMEKGELGREDVKGKMRDKLAFIIRRATGKDPIIMPMIVEV